MGQLDKVFGVLILIICDISLIRPNLTTEYSIIITSLKTEYIFSIITDKIKTIKKKHYIGDFIRIITYHNLLTVLLREILHC